MLSFLYETSAFDSSGTAHAIRLTNGGGYNHPTAPGFYEPRLQSATDATSGIFVQRSVFDSGKLGAGTAAFGAVTAANSDGGLSSWLSLGFGRPARLLLGDDTGPYSGFTPVLAATASQVTVTDQTLAIGWSSRMTELNLPACPATFAGTNSGMTGLEGLETDIGGQNKPWAMGRLLNFPPVLLNGSLRIFGWNFGTDGSRLPTHSLDKVMFRGAAWTLETSAGTGALASHHSSARRRRSRLRPRPRQADRVATD